MRIVSLLPSATEMICELGLRDQLVGVTHECDFPISVTGLPKVTSTLIPHDASSAQIDALVRRRARGRQPLYQLNIPALQSLRPDLIVTQALCDVCAVDESQVQQAACEMKWGPRIVNLEPTSFAGVLDAMQTVADAAEIAGRGAAVIERIDRRAKQVARRCQDAESHPTVVFLEWVDPLFCGGHWNPELVELAGGVNLIGAAGARSRRFEWSELTAADPDVLFIACCGFSIQRTLADLPLLARKPGWNDLNAVKNNRIYVTDGSAYFNRPGPRLVESLEILAYAIHPTLVPLPDSSRLFRWQSNASAAGILVTHEPKV